MNNMNMMNMMKNMKPLNVDDKTGWTLKFVKKDGGKETTIKIENSKTVLEAINKYRLIETVPDDMKYKHGEKELQKTLEICQSGLFDGSTITVEAP